MRRVVTEAVAAMDPPSAELRAEAVRRGGDAEYNAGLQDTLPALTTIEVVQPPAPLPPASSITVAAWNIERAKRVEDSAALLRAAGADIVLATELDHGMARSGQRHTARDLAACLGMGYVFGTEFVELATGDPYETGLFAELPNRHGLHGNAVLSRFPLQRPALIPLDAGGLWFVSQPKNDGQLRIGGRMAIAAQIEIGGAAMTVAAVHFESESDAEGRRAQAQAMLAGLEQTYGAGPAVIGGDLNTAALTGQTDFACLHRPQTREPCFDALAAAGFDWRSANTGAPTTRAAPGKPVSYPLQHLDWLFLRRVKGLRPATIPAVSRTGAYLSDHELITVEVAL